MLKICIFFVSRDWQDWLRLSIIPRGRRIYWIDLLIKHFSDQDGLVVCRVGRGEDEICLKRIKRKPGKLQKFRMGHKVILVLKKIKKICPRNSKKWNKSIVSIP